MSKFNHIDVFYRQTGLFKSPFFENKNINFGISFYVKKEDNPNLDFDLPYVSNELITDKCLEGKYCLDYIFHNGFLKINSMLIEDGFIKNDENLLTIFWPVQKKDGYGKVCYDVDRSHLINNVKAGVDENYDIFLISNEPTVMNSNVLFLKCLRINAGNLVKCDLQEDEETFLNKIVRMEIYTLDHIKTPNGKKIEVKNGSASPGSAK